MDLMIGRTVLSPACQKLTLDAYYKYKPTRSTLESANPSPVYSLHNGLGVVKDDSHLVVADPPDTHKRLCDLGYLKA